MRSDLLHAAIHVNNKMAAIIHYGLPGTAFDTYTAKYIAESRDNPNAVWMILPENHLVEIVKQSIVEQKIPYISSHITTISAFAETVVSIVYPKVHILTPVEQKLIFFDIVEKNPTIWNMFSKKTNNMDYSRNSIDFTLVENIITLYNTLKFQNAVLPQRNDKLRALASIFTTYETICEKKKIADIPTIIRLAATAIRNGMFPLKSVYLYGIFSPNAREVELLEAIRTMVKQLIEFVPYVTNNKIFSHQNNVISAKNSTKEFAESIFQKFSITPIQEIKKIGVFPNRIAEFSAITEEICNLLENGVQPSDIAVVTPEVSRYVELAKELFPDFYANGQNPKFTSSLGYPIFRNRTILAIFSLLKTIIGDYTTQDMITLFSYPYFFWGKRRYISPKDLIWISRTAGISGGKQQWLIYPKNLLKGFASSRDTSNICSSEKTELAKKIQKIGKLLKKLNNIFSLLNKFSQEKHSFAEYINGLRNILKELRYPQGHLNRRLSLEDAQNVEYFFSVLDSINVCESQIHSEQISLDKFYAILLSCVKTPDNKNRYIRNTKKFIKIIEFHEIIHQKIPYIFLAGLTADVLPRVNPRLPLLTMAETLETRTQIYKESLKKERYAFLSVILAGKKSVYLSTPTMDGETKKIPSPWIKMFKQQDIEWKNEKYYHSIAWVSEYAGRLIAKGLWDDNLDSVHIPDLSDVERRIKIEKDERAGFPTTVYDAVFTKHPLCEQFKSQYSTTACFTVTELERYAACPFRWYTEMHLKLKAHPNLENEERLELGNVIHRTMYRLISEAKNYLPSRETRDVLISDLKRIATEEFSNTGLTTPKWKVLRNRFIGTPSYHGRLEEVIDHEIVLFEAGYITPKEFLEYTFSMKKIPGIPLPDGNRLRLEGRIDRIHFLNGTYIVTDYKIGRTKNTEEIKSGKSLQLPLYLAAMNYLHSSWKQGSGTYYRIATDAVEETKPLDTDANYLIQDALSHAARYRSGMQHGLCQPIYNKTYCKHCRERFICRFNQLRSLSEETH
ncbi:MAG TPA: exodeoxyribonuclease V subunit gamma [Methanocorpusculum sp.]|nr:exodeoxyribonuclease V subunit gamma [Methanocorpusculum sp.]